MIFDHIPAQKRWRAIGFLVVAAFGISILYAWQVKEIYARADALAQKTAVVQDPDLELVNRQVRLKELGAALQGGHQPTVNIQSPVELLRYIEEASAQRNLMLIQLPNETAQEIEGYQIGTTTFSVQGTFHEIIQFAYQIEAADRVASIQRLAIGRREVAGPDGRIEVLVGDFRIHRSLVTPSSANHEAS